MPPGYRLYIESLLDELSRQVKVLFNRLDPATLLWPGRKAFTALLELLNDPELAAVWQEDETIGWVYQYFNGEDERRQMRAESQAPRTSRELAVRNQFFTPRYVVQFLTDNSLGQLWVEMRQGNTRLAELDYLVKDSERLPRPAKDPRDLRLLDPACGSGHFLLYGFDLLAGDPSQGLAGIYLEAWRAEEQPPSSVTGNSLRRDYPTEEALLKAVPELVLRHNLHGVDIDPRAAQIAALALWMRAQRGFQEAGLPAAERPPIRRTNVVTAEPMPGDQLLVLDFSSGLEPRVLGELFQQMVKAMELAGELGSLLRIDQALEKAVAEARRQFLEEEQLQLPVFEPPARQLGFDLSGISDSSFFDSAEERIRGGPCGLRGQSTSFDDGAAPPVRRGRCPGHRLHRPDPPALRRDADDPPLWRSEPCCQAGVRERLPPHQERPQRRLRGTGHRAAASWRLPRGDHLAHRLLPLQLPALARGGAAAGGPPTVFADLGQGVLDSAMVEVAAYCQRKGGRP
ncbi:MAG: SAM-dependent methyltransferase [Cyanobacteria bacterium K_Offshore_surface_m2_239]|nr:SAM-dependent methyltransferase [Cyanobacteria bacterium K_Offshore_surface_m2_239]